VYTFVNYLAEYMTERKNYVNKIMFIWTRSLSNAFRQFTVYVRINVISELFKPVEKKSNNVISNCTAAMIL